MIGTCAVMMVGTDVVNDSWYVWRWLARWCQWWIGTCEWVIGWYSVVWNVDWEWDCLVVCSEEWWLVDCYIIVMDGIVTTWWWCYCRAQPRPVDGRYSLKGSVFSEAFLVLGRVRPQGGRAPIIVIALIKVVAFLDFRCTNFLDALLQKYCVLWGPRPSSVYPFLRIEVATMVLIDSSGRELSNGCHIVNFDYFDFIDEILALEPDLDLLVTF